MPVQNSNLDSLLRDFDRAVLTWLDTTNGAYTGCSITALDGSNIKPYYTGRQRWDYQYDPSTGAFLDYTRVRQLPVVAVRRSGYLYSQDRFIHPSAKLKIKTEETAWGEINEPSSRRIWVATNLVPVDISYDIFVASNFVTEHNLITESIIGAFKTGETYLDINGFVQHMRFVGHSDESTAYELDDERVFSSVISTEIRGYLFDASSDDITDVSNVVYTNIDITAPTNPSLTITEAYNNWVAAGYPID